MTNERDELRAANAGMLAGVKATRDAGVEPAAPVEPEPTSASTISSEPPRRAGQRVVAYMTPAELAAVKAAAERDRSTLSAWARRVLLDAADASRRG